MKKIGVCLSGGGIRSVAHLGALQALHEMGYEITDMVGVSGGAIVTAFYTHGYTVEEMINLSYKLNWLTLPIMKPILTHYLKGRKQVIPGRVTYTLMNGHTIVDTPHAEAVVRSCNIPGLPAIDGVFMDGCIINNYPVHLVDAKKKICFNVVNTTHPTHTRNYLKQLSYVNDMYVLQNKPKDAIDLITEYVDPLKANKKIYRKLILGGYLATKEALDAKCHSPIIDTYNSRLG